jgi:hypothetical protein
LNRRLKVTRCELVKPAVTIVRGSDGKYNFETKEQPGAAFNLSDFKLSNGTLVYLDKKTGEKTEWNDFNLAVEDLSIAGNVIKSASFKGSFDCREVLQKDFKIENLRAPVKAVKGIYHFDALTIGALVYFDKKAGEKTELKEFSLAIKDLSVVETSGRMIKNIAFTGSMDCKELRKGSLRIDNVKSPIKSLSVNKIYFELVYWYRFSRMTPYVNGRNHGQYTVLGSLGCVLGQGGAVDPSAGT